MSTHLEDDHSRICVALSGGVDSSTVAALLKEEGHEVIGLTMLLKDSDTAEDAQKVADALSIPLHVMDCRDRFQACVIRPFLESYRKGETPIPCVHCNRKLKFGDVMEKAQSLGCTALATGHYARRVIGAQGAELHSGADQSRDQSYFLFSLTQEQIEFLRFPLADKTKDETRTLAKAFHLPTANKPDSQDICFVPDGDYVAVLSSLDPQIEKKGAIVDQQGHILGQHKGIIHFTIGQRKGLNLSTRKGDHNAPLFVLGLDPEKNEVIVGPREALAETEVRLKDVNWLAPEYEHQARSKEGLEVTVRLRSTQKPTPARFFLTDEEGREGREGRKGLILLAEPMLGVSAGQAGVLTLGPRILGGGWIIKKK